MQISNHAIPSIWHKTSSNLSSGTIAPRFIVTHYTANWSGSGARDWLLGAAGGTTNTGSSAHVVIDRDGTAWQIARFNRRAWHAGPSKYGNLKNLNSHSVGLEFVNPGYMKSDGNGGWFDWAGNALSDQALDDRGGYILAPHQIVGSDTYAWPVYTQAQLDTGRAIIQALIDKYDIDDIITHEEIDTRNWKTDPGPAFPQQAFKDMLGEDDDPSTRTVYRVDATRLNIRGGPGTTFERIDPPGNLPQGTEVEVVQRSGVWGYVVVTGVPGTADSVPVGLKGWVHTGYIERQFT